MKQKNAYYSKFRENRSDVESEDSKSVTYKWEEKKTWKTKKPKVHIQVIKTEEEDIKSSELPKKKPLTSKNEQ